MVLVSHLSGANFKENPLPRVYPERQPSTKEKKSLIHHQKGFLKEVFIIINIAFEYPILPQTKMAEVPNPKIYSRLLWHEKIMRDFSLKKAPYTLHSYYRKYIS